MKVDMPKIRPNDIDASLRYYLMSNRIAYLHGFIYKGTGDLKMFEGNETVYDAICDLYKSINREKKKNRSFKEKYIESVNKIWAIHIHFRNEAPLRFREYTKVNEFDISEAVYKMMCVNSIHFLCMQCRDSVSKAVKYVSRRLKYAPFIYESQDPKKIAQIYRYKKTGGEFQRPYYSFYSFYESLFSDLKIINDSILSQY